MFGLLVVCDYLCCFVGLCWIGLCCLFGLFVCWISICVCFDVVGLLFVVCLLCDFLVFVCLFLFVLSYWFCSFVWLFDLVVVCLV